MRSDKDTASENEDYRNKDTSNTIDTLFCAEALAVSFSVLSMALHTCIYLTYLPRSIITSEGIAELCVLRRGVRVGSASMSGRVEDTRGLWEGECSEGRLVELRGGDGWKGVVM